jgi:hypothetical protein
MKEVRTRNPYAPDAIRTPHPRPTSSSLADSIDFALSLAVGSTACSLPASYSLAPARSAARCRATFLPAASSIVHERSLAPFNLFILYTLAHRA